MANRILALAGSGRGPWVCTMDLGNTRVKAVGLVEGAEVEVWASANGQDEGELVGRFSSNGIFSATDARFHRVVCLRSPMALITFLSEERRAIQSA